MFDNALKLQSGKNAMTAKNQIYVLDMCTICFIALLNLGRNNKTNFIVGTLFYFRRRVKQ